MKREKTLLREKLSPLPRLGSPISVSYYLANVSVYSVPNMLLQIRHNFAPFSTHFGGVGRLGAS